MDGQILKGDGTWPWTALVDGNDIVVTGLSTAFGGDSDSQDDGSTASGFNTKGHADLFAASLPMRDDNMEALRGSPIPRMPFGLHADGTRNPEGCWIAVSFDRLPEQAPAVLPVIDLGPGKRTGHVLDLTVAAARLRDPGATANDFLARVTYRIIGGARYTENPEPTT